VERAKKEAERLSGRRRKPKCPTEEEGSQKVSQKKKEGKGRIFC